MFFDSPNGHKPFLAPTALVRGTGEGKGEKEGEKEGEGGGSLTEARGCRASVVGEVGGIGMVRWIIG